LFRLPKLRKDAKASLTKTLDDLSALPPPPSSNPFPEVLTLLKILCGKIEGSIIGKNGREDLMRACKASYEKFKRNTAATHPQFTPFVRDTCGAESEWQIDLDDTDDHVTADSASEVEPSVKMNLSEMREYLQG
jgi:hypothetical protein